MAAPPPLTPSRMGQMSPTTREIRPLGKVLSGWGSLPHCHTKQET